QHLSTRFPYTTLFRSIPLEGVGSGRVNKSTGMQFSAKARCFSTSGQQNRYWESSPRPGCSSNVTTWYRRTRLEVHQSRCSGLWRSEEHTSELQSRENI